MTSFVGRRRELSEARRLLGRTRLLTFTGVGGVGKTRLALRVARDARRTFEDGVWLVELAPLQDEELLPQTVASTLGLADRSARSALDCLADFVADKRLLIVLDNCEHLLDACALLAGRLLGTADGVRILATSRQPLGIGGEIVFEVAPLSVPAPDQPMPSYNLDEFEATRLFMERSAEAVPELVVTDGARRAVMRLCQRLDGIPLAIELAAVRLRSLSPEQILKRLDDRFRLLTGGDRTASRRQQTLRAAIDWSHDLCSPGERTLWGRLSIFAGGFDLQAAEDVCSSDAIPPEDIYDLVAGLIDKSIVVREDHGGGVRYRLLETIRQYGRTLLAESGEEELLRRRHRDHYQQMVMRSEEASCGPHQLRHYELLHLEHANVRAALDFCLTEPNGVPAVLRIVTANWPYWIFYGILGEGRRWLTLALEQDQAPTAERAKAMWVAGRFALHQSDLAGGLALLRECTALANRLGDASAEAHATELFGMAALLQGDYSRAIALQEDALNRYRAISEPPGGWGAEVTLYLLSLAAAASGDLDRAAAFGEECLTICELHGTDLYRPVALWALGFERYRRGELPQAAALIEESLRLQRSIHDLWNTAQCIESLAWLAAADGRHQRSARLLGAAHTIWRSLGSSMPDIPPFADFHAPCERRLRGMLGDEAFTTALEQGADLTLDQAITYALNEKTAVSARPEQAPRTPTALTPREHQVAELVAQGLTNKDIAATLVIAQRTAEGHVEHILEKLGFTSRAQIASWATSHNAH
ncbi:ATP-binding protein [Actinomadura sp. HBU206391]|uniref:ATP-binding protein n=1 Tax=Actinomadura sp. HBU206391 TaxID=2731692 RepID=UPI0029059D98|nr:LuxR C-terminal-related transcriptional regulator [Actinomadura sp. HBU206391]